MTKDQLEKYVTTRNELLLVTRQLEICGDESRQAARLKARADLLTAELDSVEEYIDSLESSFLRQVATLRYVEGLSLKDTAAIVGYSPNHLRSYYCNKLFLNER